MKVFNPEEQEQYFLKKYKEYLFPVKILKSGHTEMFDRDVLGLDVD